MEIVPLKLSGIELEKQAARYAVISNRKEIIKCYYTWYELCKRDPHKAESDKGSFGFSL